jgi:hypothetical protein
MAEDNNNQSYKVDLDSLDSSMVAEEIELNPDANPMEGPPPIDDGVHRVKLYLSPDWEQKETKPNKAGEKRTYFATKFSAGVVSEDSNNNRRVFERVNTLVFDGKNPMAYIILQILGGAKNAQARAFVESLTTPLALAKAFREALAGEPIIKVSTKWVAQYNDGTPEAPKYKTALSGQKNFPKVPGSDRYNHVINIKGTGEVAAQAKIQDYFPD